MQSFDTESDDSFHSSQTGGLLIVGPIEDLPEGSCKTLELPEGHQIVVFNVNGEYCAISNFCPHKGAALSEGILCGHVLECALHGWQFDVRTGEGITVPEEPISRYEVVIEEGIIKVTV